MPKINEIDKKDLGHIALIGHYANNPKGFFLLTGPNGTGKSFVAEAIYELHTPYKLPYYDSDLAIFITQADMNEKWLDSKNEGSSKELSERMKNTKLLVLDDLGTRTPSDAFADFIYAVIDHRWRLKDTLGTIITTNLNAKQVAEKFSSAILSRISSGLRVRFEGEDRRVIDF